MQPDVNHRSVLTGPLGLGILLLLSPLVASGQIMDMQLDLAQVRRGTDTITATITVRNPTGGNLTYYVAGLTQPSGATGFYAFSPTRRSITLPAGAVDSVDVTWSPPAGTPLGMYDFHCRLYRTAMGTDTYFTGALPGAFEVVEPPPPQVLSMALNPAQVGRGAQTVTASITLHNPGGVSKNCYVAGLAQKTGSTGLYAFSPTRRLINLAPGETNVVEASWAPPSGVVTGAYDFLCKIYKTSTGTDIYHELAAPAAFTVIDPYDASIAEMTCTPALLASGVGTITAAVTAVNTGLETLTFYVAGLAQQPGDSGFFAFSPARQSITLDAGQTGTVQVTWSPPPGIALGTYNFTCRLYVTSGGTDVYDEQILTSAFAFYDPFSARGSITVTLGPAEVIAAGARWRMDAGAWRSSGETLEDLYIGFHSIDFLPVEGWSQPEAITLTLLPDEHYQATASYTSGRLVVDVQAGQLVVRWPGTVTGLQLKTSTTLGASADWGPVSGVTFSEGQHAYHPAGPTGFYRLAPN